MRRPFRLWQAGVVIAAYGLALAAVAWRQSATHEKMAGIAALADEIVVAADRRDELERELLRMDRRWVGEEAGRRLGLRTPTEEEIVIAPGGAP